MDLNEKKRRKLSDREIQRLFGDAKQVAEEMDQYKKDQAYANSIDMRGAWENKYVVIYQEKIQASGSTLGSVMQKTDRLRLPRSSVVVKYFSHDEEPKIVFNY